MAKGIKTTKFVVHTYILTARTLISYWLGSLDATGGSDQVT